MKNEFEKLIGDLKNYDYFFCKILTKNDDSGRHGVLIPVFAYSMFPKFPQFDPTASENYTEEIQTTWPQISQTKISYWKHYHRYPERRMTSLIPALLNESKVPQSMMLVCKHKDVFSYTCMVIKPNTDEYTLLAHIFNLELESNNIDGKSSVLTPEYFNENHSPLNELLEFIKKINKEGYTPSLRKGDTGIGYTFETLLGIEANSSKEPDYKGIEIKCSRSKQIKEKRKSSTGKQTLLTLIPNWGKLKNRHELVEKYGFDDLVRERRGIYCTIKVLPNSYGFYLLVNEANQKISIMQGSEEVVFYEFERLKNALENKHKESLFITAHSRLNDENEEEFLFDSAVYCNQVNFENFIELIKENLLGVDFAIHIKDGKARDHGFLWRLENKKYLFRLFETVQEVI